MKKKYPISFMLTLTISFMVFGAFAFTEQPCDQRDNGAVLIWDKLLQDHVSQSGFVDYKGMKADPMFERCIATFEKMHPESDWSESKEMAFWINVYNAFTVKLILDNYPLQSIKDLDKPWDQKFITLSGNEYTLNDIEHEILRKKFKDPRIHFAINCASVSCPALVNRAYFESNLDKTLNQAARNFINDSKKNMINSEKVEISKLFDWFRDDFAMNGSVIPFINMYSSFKIPLTAELNYMEYDWKLNGK